MWYVSHLFFESRVDGHMAPYLTKLRTNRLTPCSKVLERLIGPHLVKKFPVFCETRMFITAFATAHNRPYPEPHQSSPNPLLPPNSNINIGLTLIVLMWRIG